MNKLDGKVAVITGGNSGIGLATAKEFARQGARVVISGRDEKTLAEAEREIGGEVLAIQADVGKLSEIDKLYDAVRERFGKIDVLFVNAGIGIFKPLETVTEEDFDLQMNVNLKGAYFTIQKSLPLLNDNASIVLNTSINAHIGMPNSSIYAASKAAVISFARTISAELVGRGIRVNALSPGFVPTAFQGKMGLPQEALEGFAGMIMQAAPLGRLEETSEIARAAVFLASPDSSYMTAADVVVDGGYMNV